MITKRFPSTLGTTLGSMLCENIFKNSWFSEDMKSELNGISDGVLMHTLHYPEIEKQEISERILWLNLISEKSESHGSMIGKNLDNGNEDNGMIVFSRYNIEE